MVESNIIYVFLHGIVFFEPIKETDTLIQYYALSTDKK